MFRQLATRTALAAALLGAAPATAATFVYGHVGVGVEANVGANTDSRIAFVNASFNPGTLSLSASAEREVIDGGNSAYVRAAISALWDGLYSALTLIWEWDIQVPDDVPWGVRTNLVIPNWRYDFVAAADGYMEVQYTVDASGYMFGLQPVYGSGDMPYGPHGGDISDPRGFGSFIIPLVAGNSYSLGLYQFGNVTSGGAANFFGQAEANFAMNIYYRSPPPPPGVIPEPATWAMLIAGFGLVGSALRRRRLSAA